MFCGIDKTVLDKPDNLVMNILFIQFLNELEEKFEEKAKFQVRTLVYEYKHRDWLFKT